MLQYSTFHKCKSVHTHVQVHNDMHKHTLTYTPTGNSLRHVIRLESTRVSRWQRLPLGTEG